MNEQAALFALSLLLQNVQVPQSAASTRRLLNRRCHEKQQPAHQKKMPFRLLTKPIHEPLRSFNDY